MSFQGFFINLDRSPERKAALEAELSRLGLLERYRRFPAVDGRIHPALGGTLKPGEAGVFQSHLAVLERNRDAPGDLHVLEDDIVLSPAMGALLPALSDGGVTRAFDVVFTDVGAGVDLNLIRALRQGYQKALKADARGGSAFSDFTVLDLAGASFAGATSYLVGRASIGKVAALLREHLDAGPTRPIDLLFQDLVLSGRLRAGVTVPFVTSIRPEAQDPTTIQGRGYDDLSVRMAGLIRRGFFVGNDPAALLGEVPTEFLSREGDPQRRLIKSVLDFMVFGPFRHF